jgi:4-hydroxy-tetrahydrodipicolinate synthase
VPVFGATFGEKVAVRCGITPAMTSLHALGGSGLLCFEPNVAPRLTVGVWNALADPRRETFTEPYAVLLRLNTVLSRFGNPRSLKAALRILGRDAGIPRRPYLPLPDAACKTLADELAALRLDRFERY